MVSSASRFLHMMLVVALALLMPLSQFATAQDHVVSTGDLHKDRVKTTQARQANQARVAKFFSSEEARKALRTARIDYQKVEKGVRLLNDEELARLAVQVEKVQNDFAAGALTNQEITYILIALAAAVIVLVLVAA